MNTILTLLHTMFYYMRVIGACKKDISHGLYATSAFRKAISHGLYATSARKKDVSHCVCVTSARKKDVSYTGLVMHEVVQIHHNGSSVQIT